MNFKYTLVTTTFLALAARAEHIRWENGFYKNWRCHVVKGSQMNEAWPTFNLYTVNRGVESPAQHYTFEALVELTFKTGAIAFKGRLLKDETKKANVFRFEALNQPIVFFWQNGKGVLAYENQRLPIECRFPKERPHP